MPEIFILVEHTEGVWVATAHDEVGVLTTDGGRAVSATADDRGAAVRRVKRDAARALGVACRFTVEGMGEGE